MLMFGQSFDLQTEGEILQHFENLAIYVVSNFEIPALHTELFFDYFQIPFSFEKHLTIQNIQLKHSKFKEQFNIHNALKAIGLVFFLGEPRNLSIEEITRLNYLIAKLHTSIGAVVYV